MVVGIDEVGRGPWAGPLVFGAVVLGGATIDGLTDSKKLTKKKREALDVLIRETAVAFGLGWVSAEELDEIGMSKACELACRRALEQITVPYSEIIIDGVVNFLKDTGKGPYVTTMKQADILVPSVSAASVLAKVARDRFMEEQDALYPGYGFASHVGYGTKQHMDALKLLGVAPIHRKSFAPIASLLGNEVVKVPNKSIVGTTRSIGNISEDTAASYLAKQGYRILERNWKTRLCEIDIVAEMNGTLYFVEVKHRKTDNQGGGLAAITAKKLQQMKFAAKMYAHYVKNDSADMRLCALVTATTDYTVVDFIEVSQ
jgi:ribonuclease HII